jgi:uncharacterized protein YgiM (DUF1202 family)
MCRQHRLALAFSLLVSLAWATSAYATPGERFYIDMDNISVRERPAAAAPVVRHLNKGDRVIEFRRQGSWIRVSQLGAVGEDGWVEISYLVPEPPYYSLYVKRVQEKRRQRESAERQREHIEQQLQEWERQQEEWAMQSAWVEQFYRDLCTMPQFEIPGLGGNDDYHIDAMSDVAQPRGMTEILNFSFGE